MPGKRTVHQFISFIPSNSETVNAPIGGIVTQFKAAQTLNVGDAVYATTVAGQVDKNVTQANYVTFVGFVVGGRRTFGEVVTQDLVNGAAIATIQAAQVGEEVLVQTSGVAIAIASALIAAGARVLAEGAGTAGRIVAGTTAGLVLGVTVDATTGANQWQKVLIGLR